MPFSSTARASAARHLRRPLRMALTAAFVTTLAACSSMDLGLGKAEPPPPCPTVRLDRDTVQAVQYVGPGRDITDMAFTIELQGYGGNCQYEDEHVIVQVVPQFVIERGPAAPEGTSAGQFDYFVAIPSYYPNPAGKQVFPLRFQFADPVTPVMVVRDAPVTLTLPRAPGESLEDEDIYLGLQLTPEQLQRNRERAAAGAR